MQKKNYLEVLFTPQLLLEIQGFGYAKDGAHSGINGHVDTRSNREHAWDNGANKVDVETEDLHVSEVMHKDGIFNRLGEAWLARRADFDLLAPLVCDHHQGGTSSRLQG